eukprot:3556313-Prymnesium_polylepis.1
MGNPPAGAATVRRPAEAKSRRTRRASETGAHCGAASESERTAARRPVTVKRAARMGERHVAPRRARHAFATAGRETPPEEMGINVCGLR